MYNLNDQDDTYMQRLLYENYDNIYHPSYGYQGIADYKDETRPPRLELPSPSPQTREKKPKPEEQTQILITNPKPDEKTNNSGPNEREPTLTLFGKNNKRVANDYIERNFGTPSDMPQKNTESPSYPNLPVSKPFPNPFGRPNIPAYDPFPSPFGKPTFPTPGKFPSQFERPVTPISYGVSTIANPNFNTKSPIESFTGPQNLVKTYNDPTSFETIKKELVDTVNTDQSNKPNIPIYNSLSSSFGKPTIRVSKSPPNPTITAPKFDIKSPIGYSNVVQNLLKIYSDPTNTNSITNQVMGTSIPDSKPPADIGETMLPVKLGNDFHEDNFNIVDNNNYEDDDNDEDDEDNRGENDNNTTEDDFNVDYLIPENDIYKTFKRKPDLAVKNDLEIQLDYFKKKSIEASKSIDDNLKKLKDAQDKISKTSSSNEEMNNEIESMKNEIFLLREELNSRINQHESVKTEASNLKTTMKLLENNRDSDSKTLESMKNEITSKKQKIDDLVTEKNVYDEKHKTLTEKLKEQEQEMIRLEKTNNEKTQSLAAKQKEILSLVSMLDEHKTQIENMLSKSSLDENSIQVLKNDLNTTNEELNSLQLKQESNKQELNKLKNEYNKISTDKTDFITTANSYKSKLDELRDANEKEIKILANKNRDIQNKLDVANAEKDETERYLNAKLQKIKRKSVNNKNFITNFLDVKSDYEDRIKNLEFDINLLSLSKKKGIENDNKKTKYLNDILKTKRNRDYFMGLKKRDNNEFLNVFSNIDGLPSNKDGVPVNRNYTEDDIETLKKKNLYEMLANDKKKANYDFLRNLIGKYQKNTPGYSYKEPSSVLNGTKLDDKLKFYNQNGIVKELGEPHTPEDFSKLLSYVDKDTLKKNPRIQNIIYELAAHYYSKSVNDVNVIEDLEKFEKLGRSSTGYNVQVFRVYGDIMKNVKHPITPINKTPRYDFVSDPRERAIWDDIFGFKDTTNPKIPSWALGVKSKIFIKALAALAFGVYGNSKLSNKILSS